MPLVPYYQVVISGYGPLDEAYARRLQSIALEEKRGKPAVVRLVFDEAYDLRESDALALKREFFVLMGWANAFEFRGPFIVREVKPHYGRRGFKLTITGQDRSLAMNRQRKTVNHTGTPQEIVQTLAESYGLGYSIDGISNVSFDEDASLLQAAESDAEMLTRLARGFGYDWYIEDGVLVFAAPQPDANADSLIYSYGINDKSILEYEPLYKAWTPTSSGAKMAGSAMSTSNVDIEEGTVFEMVKDLTDAAEDIVGLSDTLAAEGEVDASEAAYSDESYGTYILDPEVGDLVIDYAESLVDPDEGSADDADVAQFPGAATPANAEDASNKLAGQVARGAQTAKGKVALRVGNMSVRPRRTVEILCPSAMDSGRFEVVDVRQTVDSSGFSTSFSVAKRGLGSGSGTSDAAEAAEAEAAVPGSGDTVEDSRYIAQRMAQLDPETGELTVYVNEVSEGVCSADDSADSIDPYGG